MFLFSQYQVELKKQLQKDVKQDVLDEIGRVISAAKDGQSKAMKKFLEWQSLVDHYNAVEKGHKDEMEKIREQIQNIDSEIDDSLLAVSDDCIAKCRTGKS